MPIRTRATDEFNALIEQALQIRADMQKLATESGDLLDQVQRRNRESAKNLLHYIALRSCDRRALQMRLATAGLSSLGRAESHVLSSLEKVLAMLHHATDRTWQPEGGTAAVSLDGGRRRLAANTKALLGSITPERGVGIMVTMPSEAAENYSLVQELLQHGMDCMRINCAHDDEAAWVRMVDHLRRAESSTGRKCKILMDLAGPKLRTGPLEPGPAVLKIQPRRDVLGRVTRPARVWLRRAESPRQAPTPADATLDLPRAFLKPLQVGDQLTFEDARDSKRTLDIVAVGSDGSWAEARGTCYLTSDVIIHSSRGDKTSVVAIPPSPSAIKLAAGDLLILTRELTPGRPAACDRRGRVLNPATIGCTAPEVFADVRAGEPIWFDDGRIGGVVDRTEADRLHVRITQTPIEGANLVADKGINLPETDLHLEAMTDKDRADLPFVMKYADIVALSFVNNVDDVRALQTLLAPAGARQPGLVLKIETRCGFKNLSAMLLEAMKSPRCGVMIARGDLAVESGFERLAEVQEEILWLCEAAHVPVIWATQVLESLAKKGQPSRAEITDAAMSHRAECVMLNKGPYVVEAVKLLDDILRRMFGHQVKKRSMLRELDSVTRFRRARKNRRRRVDR